MSGAGGLLHDLRYAATWGFWSGASVLTLYYALAVILRHGVRPPGLWLETSIAFVAGAAAGVLLFFRLRRLERDAERRTP